MSITGHGRAEPGAGWVAFGDDAAVAGGLVAWDGAGPVLLRRRRRRPRSPAWSPRAAALEALATGGRWVVDVALSRVAAWAAGPTAPVPVGVSAAPPRARPVERPGPALGEHTAGGARLAAAVNDELLVRRAEVGGSGPAVDVRVRDGVVVEVGRDLRAAAGGRVLDAGGGALLPGLHDHHIHLLATAADAASVRVGPPDVRDRAGFARALRDADRRLPPGQWIRATGYHESVAGDLDRTALDRIVPDRPVRVQDRSGARWTLNRAGIDAVGLDELAVPEVERDAADRPTGRVHRGDALLGSRLPEPAPPDLAALGRAPGRLGRHRRDRHDALPIDGRPHGHRGRGPQPGRCPSGWS